MKDRTSGRLLLHGPNKNGLYQFFPFVNKLPTSAMVGERVSVSQWHSRMGHPALRIVRHVLSTFQLPVASTKESSCSTCLGSKSKQLPFSSSLSIATCPLELIYTRTNKTVQLNENIAILLKPDLPYSLMHICHPIFGMMPFPQHVI